MSAELQPITSYTSGSVGDTVHSRNQYGPYTRARTTPTDPNTPRQQNVRRWWAQITDRWGRFLTQAQRESWADYAAQRVVRSGSLRSTRLTGQQAFIRANASAQTRGIPFFDDGPTDYRDPQWTLPVDVICPGPGIILFTIDPNDEWADQNGAGLVVAFGNGQPSSVNFFKAPFRRVDIVRGNAAPPPAASQWRPDPWGPVTADRRWIRAYAFLADGRTADARTYQFTDNV